MRHNTRILALLWTFTAASLAGCPSPPEAAPGAGSAPTAGPPPGGGGAPGGKAPGGDPPSGGPAAGANAPGAGGAPPAGGGATAGGSADNLGMPSFKDQIDGDSITISVTVKGGSKGQLDFVQLGDPPKALHVEPYDGEGPFKVTAPAKIDGDVYVVAMNYANGTSIGAKDDVGTLKKPITLAGKDLSVEIKIGDEASWFERPTDMPPGPGAGGPPGTPPTPPKDTPPTPPEGGGDGPPPDGDAPPPGGDAGTPPK